MNAATPRRVCPTCSSLAHPSAGPRPGPNICGTHPDIFFPKYKDQCFFALDLPNFRLTRTEADYAELFADSGDARVDRRGFGHVPLFGGCRRRNPRATIPHAKILIFLREQEDYLPSLHNQFLREFAEEIEDFETVWRLSGRRPPDTIPTTCLEPRTLDYAAMGRFREQVERYLAVFPAEQVRVIQFRDWTAEPRTTYLGILDFLGLDDDGRTDFPRSTRG